MRGAQASTRTQYFSLVLDRKLAMLFVCHRITPSEQGRSCFLKAGSWCLEALVDGIPTFRPQVRVSHFLVFPLVAKVPCHATLTKRHWNQDPLLISAGIRRTSKSLNRRSPRPLTRTLPDIRIPHDHLLSHCRVPSPLRPLRRMPMAGQRVLLSTSKPFATQATYLAPIPPTMTGKVITVGIGAVRNQLNKQRPGLEFYRRTRLKRLPQLASPSA